MFPLFPFSCGPRGLEDRKGNELLSPSVQKSLFSGSLILPHLYALKLLGGQESLSWGSCASLSSCSMNV